MGRTAFLVDGFNLYHSLKEAQRALATVGFTARRRGRLAHVLENQEREWTGVSTS